MRRLFAYLLLHLYSSSFLHLTSTPNRFPLSSLHQLFLTDSFRNNFLIRLFFSFLYWWNESTNILPSRDPIKAANCSHYTVRAGMAYRSFSPIIVSLVVPVSCTDHRSEHRTQFPCGVHRSSFDTFVQSSVAEFVGYCSIGLTRVEIVTNGGRSGLRVTEKSRLRHH